MEFGSQLVLATMTSIRPSPLTSARVQNTERSASDAGAVDRQPQRLALDQTFPAIDHRRVRSMQHDFRFGDLLRNDMAVMLRLADRFKEQLRIEVLLNVRDQTRLTVPQHAAIIAADEKPMTGGGPGSQMAQGIRFPVDHVNDLPLQAPQLASSIVGAT